MNLVMIFKRKNNSERDLWYKLNSYLTYFRRGFMAHLIRAIRTGITEVMGLNPVGASIFFWALYFTTAKISFTSISTVHSEYDIYNLYTCTLHVKMKNLKCHNIFGENNIIR